MHDDSMQPPQLLVSVRNAREARDALAGGCDILDVKEPAHGSLGMADVGVIRDVIVAAGVQAITISAALGETREWRNRTSVPVLPHGLQYVKLGTAGLTDVTEWEREWRSVRERFEAVAQDASAASHPSGDSAGPPQWVAVAYADWQRAAAPPPEEILRTAVESECAGLLFDTYYKDGRSLFDVLPMDAIAVLLESLRETNLFVALAGSLSIADIATAAALHPDVIAVRTAVCRDGNRNGPISRESVRRLREVLEKGRGIRDEG
jgi:hypothetical protein